MKKTDKGGADWNLWIDMEQAEIWEAVALSLDIEPNSLPELDFRPIVGGPFDNCPDEFKRRLKLAVSKFDGPHTKISLSSLHEWAAQLTRPWAFPDEFPPEPAASHKSAPVVANGASGGTLTTWTPERKAEAQAYRAIHGLKQTALHYKVSQATISKHIPAGKATATKAHPTSPWGVLVKRNK